MSQPFLISEFCTQGGRSPTNGTSVDECWYPLVAMSRWEANAPNVEFTCQARSLIRDFGSELRVPCSAGDIAMPRAHPHGSQQPVWVRREPAGWSSVRPVGAFERPSRSPNHASSLTYDTFSEACDNHAIIVPDSGEPTHVALCRYFSTAS